MSAYRRMRLGDILAAKGVVSREQIEALLMKSGDRQRRIGKVLIDEGIVTEEVIYQSLAEQRGLRYADITNFHIPAAFVETIPFELMQRYQFVPMENAGDVMVVATTDPNNLPALDALEVALNRQIEIVVTTPTAIQKVLRRIGPPEQAAQAASGDARLRPVREQEDGQREEIRSQETTDAGGPSIKLMNTAIVDAVRRRASDIHIESTGRNVLIKYRIDGVLCQATEPVDMRFHNAIVSHIKALGELDIAERRLPQCGRFALRIGGKTVDFHVSILPTIFGEDVVIRIRDKDSITAGIGSLSLDRLGFDERALARFRESIRKPYGIVLVTGPAGSGKTTSLYAAISEISTGNAKLITIEDPVEYQLQGAVQIAVNEKKGITFASGLRLMLEHDPDKIMVGEVQNAETAQIAVKAALVGHAVFTAVVAVDSFEAISRFLNCGIEPYTVLSSINCVLSQRLVRMLCQQCKKPVVPTRSELEESAVDFDKHKDHPYHGAVGCKECNFTGFRGRSAITEVLNLSEEIRRMILEKRLSSDIRKAAAAEGMTTLRESALAKVFAGNTTFKEINRVASIE